MRCHSVWFPITLISIVLGLGACLQTKDSRTAPTPADEGPRRNIQRKLARPPMTFDKPQEAMRFYAQQRAPFGQPMPVEEYLAAWKEIRARRASTTARRNRPGGRVLKPRPGSPGGIQGWQCIGPGNIGGRTRTLAIHPFDHDVMYAGGVSGGVWKTFDGGGSWAPLDDFLPNLSVCSMVMDPTDPDVLYVGTGEGYYPVSNVPNQEAVFERGLGIFKTTDGGASWNHLSGTINSNFYYVNDLRISSDNSQHLFAATSTGVWRSLNGGGNWTRVNPGNGNTLVGCTELAMRTDTSPPALFAGFGSFYSDGLYRSTDNGNSWVKLAGGFPVLGQGRIELAIAPSNQNLIYASVARSAEVADPYSIKGVYRSQDGGNTWVQRVDLSSVLHEHLLSNPLAGICNGQGYNQGWYDHVIEVDPLDPDVVWVGGIDLFRSDDGGVNWGLASAWWQKEVTVGYDGPNYCHADVHLLRFHPDYDGVTNQTMYVGSDGGLYRTDNALAATTTAVCTWLPPSQVEFVSLNNGYSTIQYYHGDVSLTSERFLGGAQDNGSSMADSIATPNGWDNVFGGDGGYCAIDPNDPDTLYVEIQFFPTMRKSTDGGATFTLATTGINNDDGLFIVPFVMDPNDSQVLWTGGERPWRTHTGALVWADKGPDFSPGRFTSAIAVAPSDSNVVYFGFSDGYVHRTGNGLAASPVWVNRSTGLRGGSAFLSSITVHPADANIAYVSYSTFGGGKLFRTVNGGLSWTDITGSGATRLPNIPVHTLAIHPKNSDLLYVGTDLGLFVSENGGVDWIPDDAGMPHAPIERLVWQGDRRLVAFTYGRSVFVTDVKAQFVGPVSGYR